MYIKINIFIFNFMSFHKKFHCFLFILIFSHFVMSPSVHQHSYIVKHDITIKQEAQALQKYFQKVFNRDQIMLSKTFRYSDFIQSGVFQESEISLTSYVAVTLSILSSTRLIL